MAKPVLFCGALSAGALFAFPLYAECVPSPDCASLGYTKTSCASGDHVLRCPFDVSKVSCIAMTCEGIGKKTCGDLCVTDSFSGCCSDSDCASGQVCNNQVCKDIICSVGDIYYSDKTCSTYLVSGKTPIGVVGKVSNGGKNGIVVEKNHSSNTMQWGCPGTDLLCITNMPGQDSGSNPELRADYNGKTNTDCIASNCGSGTTGYYCKNRNVEGVTGWYLPAGGVLYDTMIGNMTTVNAGLSKISGSTAIPFAEQSYYYWSSSEYGSGNAWRWKFGNGTWYYSNKHDAYHVRCVLAF